MTFNLLWLKGGNCCDQLLSGEPYFFSMKKQEDPAFLFYPKEIMSITEFLNFEDLGKFLKIICSLHGHGHLTEEKFLHLCHGVASERLLELFEKDSEGKFFSAYLDKEVEKRKKFGESRRKNIQKRYEKSTSVDTYVDTSVLHMVNANVNVNEDVNKSIKGNKFKSEDFGELPDQFIQSSIERLKIQKDITVTRLQVSQMWSIFKAQNLAGDKWYNSEADVYRHFSNWIKNQTFKHETDQRPTKTGRNAGQYELLERLRQEHGGNFGEA